MALLKNLEAAELLVQLDRKRHLKLAPAGDPGDTKEVDDRHLLPDRAEGRVIADLQKKGRLEVVPGGFSSDLTSVAVGAETWPGLRGFDLVVDLAGAAGVTVDVGPVLPVGAIPLSLQASVDELVVAGGSSVAVGLGIAADPDKYGLTADLLKDGKIDFFSMALTPLGAPEQLVVAMVTGGGALGDTAATDGLVRVKVSWIEAPASLPDAP